MSVAGNHFVHCTHLAHGTLNIGRRPFIEALKKSHVYLLYHTVEHFFKRLRKVIPDFAQLAALCVGGFPGLLIG